VRQSFEQELSQQWRLQSSAEIDASGEEITASSFDDSGWYLTTVPSTVLAALVRNGVYDRPYFGRNLEQIDTAQFKGSWWYRTVFVVPESNLGMESRLVFDGINYRANVWINGVLVASSESLYGAFRQFELDVSSQLQQGNNVLAVEVLPPHPGDPTIGFVDWNPRPPDENMGLWRGVTLRFSREVALDDVFVHAKIDTDSLDEAWLTVAARLTNSTDRPLVGVLEGEIDDRRFSAEFSLEPSQSKEIELTAEQVSELDLQHPRLWWPVNQGEPNLYQLRLAALVEGQVSDLRTTTFGVRSIEDYVTEEGHRGYRVNGRDLLIRGGGWVDDLLLADTPDKLEAQMAYTRHMNLNTIRLEGFWGSSQTLYDLADKHGILLMAGWSCHWEWEEYLGRPVDRTYGGITTAEDRDLIASSLVDQVTWLRNHPSIFVWVVGSDLLPHPDLERRYIDDLARLDPSRPMLSSCKMLTSEVTGSTGVKMAGPYDYVTPNYWYENTRNGGAFGFNTETGPGPQPPPLESIERMIPPEHLWPIDEMWDYHCGRNQFNTLDRYRNAFEHRYGRAESLEQFAFRAQAASYEAIRAMFEAFAVRRPQSTGVIQWMLNSAWPEMYWQLYDYYLMPTGAFYGTRVACQPQSLVYDYGDGAVYAVNTSIRTPADMEATITVLDLQGRQLLRETHEVALAPDSSVRLSSLDGLGELTPVYFLDLRLTGKGGAPVARNFYWLSNKKDRLDERRTLWYVTPNAAFADFTALDRLPQVVVDAEPSFTLHGEEQELTVTLFNPSESVAFFIELQVVGDASGRTVLPVLWDDNYISLLPGERRTIRARFASADLHDEEPVFRLSGWNIDAQ